jgi:hypothetical protein
MSATARIGDDLAQAIPLKLAKSSETAVAFRGSSDRVDFVRTSLGINGDFRLDRVLLVIEPRNKDGVAVVRVARPFSATDFATTPKSEGAAMLLQLRRPAIFDYVDINGKTAEDWQPDMGLPSQVELKLAAFDAERLGLRYLIFPIVSGFSQRKKDAAGGLPSPSPTTISPAQQ